MAPTTHKGGTQQSRSSSVKTRRRRIIEHGVEKAESPNNNATRMTPEDDDDGIALTTVALNEQRQSPNLAKRSASNNINNNNQTDMQTLGPAPDESNDNTPPPEASQANANTGRRHKYRVAWTFVLVIITIATAILIFKYGFASSNHNKVAPTAAPTASYTGWFPLGDLIIDPQGAALKFGWSVAVSGETRVIAVGSPEGGAGRVYAYSLDLNALKWKPLGHALTGSNPGDAFGSSIALSAQGYTLAVGAWDYGQKAGQVTVHQYTAGQWHAKGQSLLGQEREGDVFGSVVALSADGNVVAASATTADVKSIADLCRGAHAGLVQVFQFNTTNEQWYQLGQTLTGEFSYEQFGYSIALSADGLILAVGIPYGDKSENSDEWAGLVKVYKYRTYANEWIQFGQTLRPINTKGRFGWSVDLSFDGKIVAVGAPLNDDNGEASGRVSVFKYNSVIGIWEPMGNDIQGQDLGRWFANTVVLSSDGLMVAASLWGDAFWREEIRYGGVRVFRFKENNQWEQVGGDLPGQTLYDPYSTTVTMSAEGNIVMSGWDEETDSGVVRAYYAGD